MLFYFCLLQVTEGLLTQAFEMFAASKVSEFGWKAVRLSVVPRCFCLPFSWPVCVRPAGWRYEREGITYLFPVFLVATVHALPFSVIRHFKREAEFNLSCEV